MSETVPGWEFKWNFRRYRMMAQLEAVVVSSHGMMTGCIVGPEGHEASRRVQEQRRSFATVELAPEKVRAIGEARMDERCGHLDE